jgi:biotin operon repressor
MTSDEEIALLKARVRELEGLLGQSGNKTIESTFRLPPALSKLLGLLTTLPTVTADMITRKLEIATDAKVAVWRLRQHLEPYGVEIQSKRHVGWWLDEPAKERVRQIVAGEITVEASTVELPS